MASDINASEPKFDLLTTLSKITYDNTLVDYIVMLIGFMTLTLIVYEELKKWEEIYGRTPITLSFLRMVGRYYQRMVFDIEKYILKKLKEWNNFYNNGAYTIRALDRKILQQKQKNENIKRL